MPAPMPSAFWGWIWCEPAGIAVSLLRMPGCCMAPDRCRRRRRRRGCCCRPHCGMAAAQDHRHMPSNPFACRWPTTFCRSSRSRLWATWAPLSSRPRRSPQRCTPCQQKSCAFNQGEAARSAACMAGRSGRVKQQPGGPASRFYKMPCCAVQAGGHAGCAGHVLFTGGGRTQLRCTGQHVQAGGPRF